MSESELLARVRELAAAGDRQAAATLRLIADRDELRRLVMALGERCAGLVELVAAKADRVAA